MSLARALALAAVLGAGALVLAGCDHLQQAEAAGPACPKGPTPYTPLGCANLANLEAMVADPADLTRGRPLTPASGAREALVIERYETAAPADPPAEPDKARETTQ